MRLVLSDFRQIVQLMTRSRGDVHDVTLSNISLTASTGSYLQSSRSLFKTVGQ